jgi:glutathione peroxidase
MKTIATLMTAMVCLAPGCMAQEKELSVNSLYDIEVKTIDGEPMLMEHYKGKVLLIVNTASKCGFTGQYDGLQKLYEMYEDKGFVVIGVPSNDFMGQEPGTNEEIQSFCKLSYGVTFPMFEKVAVKGKNQHDLYAYLTSKKTNPEFGGKISWNFNKFLISRDGQIENRFGSRAKPDNKELISAIETELGK